MNNIVLRFEDNAFLRGERLHIEEFSGGGGASLGYKLATGRDADLAVNHDREATAMHRANHIKTRHRRKDVWEVDPIDALREMGIPESIINGWSASGFLDYLIESGWFSPDCKHFSKAKGASLFDKRIRALAYIMIKWAGRGGARRVAPGKAGRVRRRGPACPRVMFFENVEEFKTWGPLVAKRCKKTRRVVKRDGTVAAPGELVAYRDQWLVPDTKRKGLYFKRWTRQLDELGAAMRFDEERACDFGAPTIRKRLYGVLKFDRSEIVWPTRTHGAPESEGVMSGALKPWRTAAECIDWSIPVPSIFTRKKPLEKATLKRIAKGVWRYILNAERPFIVSLTHQGNDGVENIDRPMMTVTGANRGEKALVLPYMVPRYGERKGQEPRTRPVTKPMPVVVPTQNGASLVATFVARQQHGGGARAMGQPVHTITASKKDQNQVVAAFLAQHNSGMVGHDAREPFSTIVGKGSNQALVLAGMVKYYGTDQDPRIDEPLHSVTTKDRFALFEAFACVPPLTPELEAKARQVASFLREHGVEIEGEFATVGEFVIYDLGMRMFVPRELYRAQSFPDSYIIDRGLDELPDGTLVEIKLTKTAQVKMGGNSVCPVMAEAFFRANLRNARREAVAA